MVSLRKRLQNPQYNPVFLRARLIAGKERSLSHVRHTANRSRPRFSPKVPRRRCASRASSPRAHGGRRRGMPKAGCFRRPVVRPRRQPYFVDNTYGPHFSRPAGQSRSSPNTTASRMACAYTRTGALSPTSCTASCCFDLVSGKSRRGVALPDRALRRVSTDLTFAGNS